MPRAFFTKSEEILLFWYMDFFLNSLWVPGWHL